MKAPTALITGACAGSDVAAVAQEGLRACLADEVIRVAGAPTQALAVGRRIAPRGLVRRVAGAATRPRRKATP